jgi:hypothetical protein
MASVCSIFVYIGLFYVISVVFKALLLLGTAEYSGWLMVMGSDELWLWDDTWLAAMGYTLVLFICVFMLKVMCNAALAGGNLALKHTIVCCCPCCEPCIESETARLIRHIKHSNQEEERKHQSRLAPQLATVPRSGYSVSGPTSDESTTNLDSWPQTYHSPSGGIERSQASLQTTAAASAFSRFFV